MMKNISAIRSSPDVFHAIADANRRALLDTIAARESAVGDLVEQTGLSYSAVSQHLQILREVGLVKRREDGRHRRYRINATPLLEVVDWTSQYERFWKTKLAALHDVLRQRRKRHG